MTAVSSSTERSTCRREAPSVRRVASSRVRWATVIEIVLKITNAPTNSEMPPNASRNTRIVPMPSLRSSEASWTASSPVWTCSDGPTSGRIARASSSGETPLAAATEIPSN